MKKKTKSKLALGLALIALGSLLIFARPQNHNQNNYTFAEEPVRVEGFSENTEGELPQKILIPDLSIDLVVKPAKIIKGYWEVFADSAAWGEGSGVPGKPGNQVIFAHAREGLFLPLRDVKQGMKVYVLTASGWYSYEVTEIKEVYPNQIEVIAPTPDETLTLYTCSGYADAKRLIVIAKRS